jgi:hypothetical protein
VSFGLDSFLFQKDQTLPKGFLLQALYLTISFFQSMLLLHSDLRLNRKIVETPSNLYQKRQKKTVIMT